MKNLEYIFVYVEYLIHLKFFLRFYNSLKELGFKIVFFTNKLSLIFFAKNRGVDVYFIRKRERELSFDEKQLIKDSIEVLANTLTFTEAKVLFSSIDFWLNEYLKKYSNVKYFFLFGDSSIGQITMKKIAKDKRIKTLFFELSNIPNKIFVDPVGVNARSSLYQNIDLLNKYDIDESEFYYWRKNYIERKVHENNIPQGVMRKKINNYLLPLDSFGYYFFRAPISKRENYMQKLNVKIIKRKKTLINYDLFDLEKDYFFFPLQVTNDSQVLINSSLNNIEAINVVLNRIKQYNIPLLIKPHPAEFSESLINKIIQLKKQNKIFIVNNNTFQLIANAKKIFTINSTVGLEALILGKEVEFLGRTFFKFFTKKFLMTYIQSYLIDIDFFSNKEVSLTIVKEVLERAKNENL